MKNLKGPNEKTNSTPNTKPPPKKDAPPPPIKKKDNPTKISIPKHEKSTAKFTKDLPTVPQVDILTDLHIQFLLEIQRENYENALVVSEKILKSEPNNKTISEFNTLLKNRENIADNDSSEEESVKEDSIKYDDEDCFNYDDDDSMKSD